MSVPATLRNSFEDKEQSRRQCEYWRQQHDTEVARHINHAQYDRCVRRTTGRCRRTGKKRGVLPPARKVTDGEEHGDERGAHQQAAGRETGVPQPVKRGSFRIIHCLPPAWTFSQIGPRTLAYSSTASPT